MMYIFYTNKWFSMDKIILTDYILYMGNVNIISKAHFIVDTTGKHYLEYYFDVTYMFI